MRIKNVPTAARYCKRCSTRTEFVSSGLFRVNAQQKSLDVWLIYKCSVCDTTWNLTVLSRVAPRSIPADLLHGFYENNPELAIRYATDAALIRQNGANPGQPELEIIGEDVACNEPLQIHLIPEQSLKIKAGGILREKLGLSRNEFGKLLSGGKLVCVSGHDLKKCKLSNEVVVEFRQG